MPPSKLEGERKKRKRKARERGKKKKTPAATALQSGCKQLGFMALKNKTDKVYQTFMIFHTRRSGVGPMTQIPGQEFEKFLKLLVKWLIWSGLRWCSFVPQTGLILVELFV